MFLLKVVFQGVGETVMLRYRLKGKAENARKTLQAFHTHAKDGESEAIEFEDDFGLSILVAPYSIVLVFMQDLDKAIDGDATFEFQQSKIKQATITRLQNNRGLLVPSGPAILTQ